MEGEVHTVFEGGKMMICPACVNENGMAYSVLSNSLVCLESECGFELEMDPVEAHQVLENEEELVCC
jgi:hypothetical protein